MSELTCKEAGRKGGTTTARKYGAEYYKRIGSMGGQRTKQKWGHLMSEWGQLGGRPRKATSADEAEPGR
jgi:general stress protein YciG